MGSASSKLRKHLQSGDEVQALQLYRSNSELRKALDPNCSYGDHHQHETPLHLASRNGMQTLLGIFLFSKGGNPNKTNSRKETCLHCVCMEMNSQSVHVCKRRHECLSYLLKWRGAQLNEGQVEKIDLAAQDEKLNTALHYAAASGLTQCVETLIQMGAPLFLENEDSLTPCDTAEKNGHASIALYLESKMVFSNDDEPMAEEDNMSMPPVEEYTGLRPQDLQEAKDQLLVETADMLSVPLFTAEALLRNHEWSREMLLESWMTDPVACCDKCGVTPPSTLFSEKPQVQHDLASPVASGGLMTSLLPSGSQHETECEICANSFLLIEEPVHMMCEHMFCKLCWEKYLNVKIQEGDAHHITCPAYDCCMLVPVDIIEGIVSRDMALRYLQFDIKAFVDSNPDMKWCPAPGCGRAVKLPDIEGGTSSEARPLGFGATGGGSRRGSKIPSDTSRGVDCGMGHYFCWECMEESHEPCSCENWTKWFHKVAEIKPETLDGTEQEKELAANCLWLVTNSKSCPNCKSPIQKNEGCNHMKCSKCKHDFCWVCLEPWKRHDTSTGGYFKCNRFEVVKKVEEQSAQMLTEAESKNKHIQELNRFVHYYTRFKNHENSYKLEEPLIKTAKDKMMKLAEAVTDNATANTETKFVEEAVQQLLKARRVLKCSYVYGYYLDGPGYKKIVFEFMQTELEECTEILSQMVNRLYLRTPRRRIVDQARAVQRKRLEFIMAISKGLVPPETPPAARKAKKKRRPSGETEDEDLRKAILASIQEVDPANPWIKDASGRHTNVASLLEWPQEDSGDSDGEVELREKRERIGKCHRAGCNKVRAKNPKTNEIHDFCSMWCLLIAQEDEHKEEKEGVGEIVLDEHMELLRALEMSRLQYLQDSGLLHVPRQSQQMDGAQAAAAVQRSKQKSRHRPSTTGSGERGASASSGTISSMEEFGIELQRFQELSSNVTSRDECKGSSEVFDNFPTKDQATTSLADQPMSSSCLASWRPPGEDIKSTLASHATPDSSSVVVASGDGGTTGAEHGDVVKSKERTQQKPTSTSAGITTPEFSSTRSSANNSTNSADTSALSNTFGSMFGAIKDLSVSNIHADESDKTHEFLTKDLAAIFSGWDLGGEDYLKAKEEEEDGRIIDDEFMLVPKWADSDRKTSTLSCTGAGNSSSFCTGAGNSSGHTVTGSGYFRRPLVLDTGRVGVADGGASTSSAALLPLNASAVALSDASPDVPLCSSSVYTSSSSRGDAAKTGLKKRHAGSSGKNSYLAWGEQEQQQQRRDRKGGMFKEVCDGTGLRDQGGLSSKSDDVDNGNEEDVSLLEMAENLLQMTADVHSRMREVEKGMKGKESLEGGSASIVGESQKGTSGWKRSSPKSKSMRRSVEKSTPVFWKSSSEREARKETRIMFRLPKTARSLEREGCGGRYDEDAETFKQGSWSFDTERLCLSLQGQEESPALASTKTTSGKGKERKDSKEGCRSLSSSAEKCFTCTDAASAVSCKDAGSKNSGKKSSKGKASSKRSSKSKVALMADTSGNIHEVAASLRSPVGESRSRADEMESTSTSKKKPGYETERRLPPSSFPSPSAPKVCDCGDAHMGLELTISECGDKGSTTVLSFPSPPPPAPPSPTIADLGKSSTTPIASKGNTNSPAHSHNEIKYSLRRNINRDELESMDDCELSVLDVGGTNSHLGDTEDDGISKDGAFTTATTTTIAYPSTSATGGTVVLGSSNNGEDVLNESHGLILSDSLVLGSRDHSKEEEDSQEAASDSIYV